MNPANDRIVSALDEADNIVNSAVKPERMHETLIKTIYDPFTEGEAPVVKIVDLKELDTEELEEMADDLLEARLELIYRSFQG